MTALERIRVTQEVIRKSRQILVATEGVYSKSTHEQIHGTLLTLRHFHTFLESNCERMIDPYSGWQRNELTKAQAQRKLWWLVEVAINRKAGVPDTLPVRRDDPDFQRWLRQFAYRVNTPRLVVRAPECPLEYRVRLAHRFTTED